MNKHGLSADLLKAVSAILNGETPIEEKMSSKEKMKKGLYNDNSNDQSDDGEGMDKVQPKALKKKFKDRKDKDIDNNGKVDKSDEYIDNKRKAISKAMNKEALKTGYGIRNKVSDMPGRDYSKRDNYSGRDAVKTAVKNANAQSDKKRAEYRKKIGMKEDTVDEAINAPILKTANNHDPKHVKQAIGIASDPRYKRGNMTGAVKAMNKISPGLHNHPQVKAVLKKQNEAVDLDTKNVDKALKHDCATHIVHEKWGSGQCIPEMHTIEETSEGEGIVTHYDILFNHGIEENVSVKELKIIKEKNHGHMKKKKNMEMKQSNPDKFVPFKKKTNEGMADYDPNNKIHVALRKKDPTFRNPNITPAQKAAKAKKGADSLKKMKKAFDGE